MITKINKTRGRLGLLQRIKYIVIYMLLIKTIFALVPEVATFAYKKLGIRFIHMLETTMRSTIFVAQRYKFIQYGE